MKLIFYLQVSTPASEDEEMTVTRGRPRRKSSAKSYVEDIVDEDDIEAPEDMDVDAEIPEEEASEGQNSASDETESEGKGDIHIGTFLKAPKVDFFINEDQFFFFLEKLRRDIDLILFASRS